MKSHSNNDHYKFKYSILILLFICGIINIDNATIYGCGKKRCCMQRVELKKSDLPKQLNCRKLNLYKCGKYDKYCEWDCNPPKNRNKIKRKFRRISREKGTYQLPKSSGSNKKGSETYRQCLEETTVISIDECGVEYEETVDKRFCKLRENIMKHKGAPSIEKKIYNLRRRLIKKRVPIGVHGVDTRKEVRSKAFPFRAVLDLRHKGSKGCTATMISPQWALTAAHCLWGHNDWYKRVVVYKNVFKCKDIKLKNRYKVDKRVIFKAYISGGSGDHDIAFIRLKKRPKLGYLDFDYTGYSDKHNFNIISYPHRNPKHFRDPDHCAKWYQYCSFDAPFKTHQMWTSDCDMTHGTSGSGVYQYWKSTNSRIIYGVATKAGTIFNIATRITRGKYKTICKFIGEDDPGHCSKEHERRKPVPTPTHKPTPSPTKRKQCDNKFPESELKRYRLTATTSIYFNHRDPNNMHFCLFKVSEQTNKQYTQIATNFALREFIGDDDDGIIRLSPQIVECVQSVRSDINKRIDIDLGYVSVTDNDEGRKQTDNSFMYRKDSYHLSGTACDVSKDGIGGSSKAMFSFAKSIICQCRNIFINIPGMDIGLGLGRTFIHIDMRPKSKNNDGFTAWTYYSKVHGVNNKEWNDFIIATWDQCKTTD